MAHPTARPLGYQGRELPCKGPEPAVAKVCTGCGRVYVSATAVPGSYTAYVCASCRR